MSEIKDYLENLRDRVKNRRDAVECVLEANWGAFPKSYMEATREQVRNLDSQLELIDKELEVWK